MTILSWPHIRSGRVLELEIAIGLIGTFREIWKRGIADGPIVTVTRADLHSGPRGWKDIRVSLRSTDGRPWHISELRVINPAGAKIASFFRQPGRVYPHLGVDRPDVVTTDLMINGGDLLHLHGQVRHFMVWVPNQHLAVASEIRLEALLMDREHPKRVERLVVSLLEQP